MNPARLSGRDVAKPVRKILRSWSTVVVKEYPSTPDGLAQLAQLMLMLAIRNKAFLKGLQTISTQGIEREITRFTEAHEALVGNLSMIRSGQAGVADVAEMVSSVRSASKEFVSQHELIFSKLDQAREELLRHAEWATQVYASEIAADMDRAAQVIWDSIDEALDSDWLDSNISWLPSDEASA